MRSLKIHFGHPVLDKIQEKPFGIIDYEKAPEVVNSRYFPDSSAYNSEHREHVLGINPRTITRRTRYNHMPTSYIHEAENVLMYRGILHSRDGSAFIDSFRAYGPHKDVRVYYSNLIKLNEFFHIHGPGISMDSEVVYGEPVIPFFVNSSKVYGHWFLETLPALWALEHGVRGKLVLSPWVKGIPAFLPAMLLPFGLSESDVLFSSEKMRFSKVFLPSKPFMLGQYITDRAKAIWNKIALFYASDVDSTMYPRKIYVSRRGIASRSLLNEAECEALFVKYGFTAVQPEQLPFSEQVRLFSRATHIAGPIGSGMHNIVFSLNPNQVRMLCLISDSFVSTGTYSCIEHMFERSFFSVYGNAIDNPKRRKSHHDYKLDLKNLDVAIQQWLDA